MIHKHKYFLDFAKEELWLAKMSEDGYTFCSVNYFGNYTFLNTQPEKKDYRIDYRVFNHFSDFQDYCTLFEDSGWKHVWGTKNSGSQYFLKIREDASDDIFSDAASKAGRYKRLYSVWLSMLATFLPLFVALFMTNHYNATAFTNPKALYFTPGLWSMTGFRFWRAFLFETPFAVGRGFLWVLFLAVLLFYLISFLRAFTLYRHFCKDNL